MQAIHKYLSDLTSFGVCNYDDIDESYLFNGRQGFSLEARTKSGSVDIIVFDAEDCVVYHQSVLTLVHLYSLIDKYIV